MPRGQDPLTSERSHALGEAIREPGRKSICRALGAFTLVVACAVSLSGCASDCRAEESELDAPLEFDDATSGLLLTWLDPSGGTHIVARPSEVPVEGRSLVRVLVEQSDRGSSDPILVADLASARTGATFVARPYPRRAWEDEIARRRTQPGSPVREPSANTEATPSRPSPQRPPSADPHEPGRPSDRAAHVEVIVYGASWCGPCHAALEHLRRRGIEARFHDIEREPDAEREMRRKLARAGSRAGSIPVIDVAGRILTGFSASAVDEALRTAAAGTAL